jgi:hypothetical protein
MFWVVAKAIQCVPAEMEEHGVNFPGVFKAVRVYFMRNGEHHMEVCAVQEVFQTGRNPFFPFCTLTFWAMPVPTGIIGNSFIRTFLTSVYVVT